MRRFGWAILLVLAGLAALVVLALRRRSTAVGGAPAGGAAPSNDKKTIVGKITSGGAELVASLGGSPKLGAVFDFADQFTR